MATLDIRRAPTCPGKSECPIFKDPDSIVRFFNLNHSKPVRFEDLMVSVLISKKFYRSKGCPFSIAGEGKKERFKRAICHLQCEGNYSTIAVSEGIGFSKTRVHQLEKSAMRKLRRKIAKELNGSLNELLSGTVEDILNPRFADSGVV